MTTRTATAPAPVYGRSDRIFRLHPTAIWRYLRTQPASFWLICLYLFFEYVRPQSIYRSIDVLPWARLWIISAGIAFVFEGAKARMDALPDGWMLAFMAIVVASSFTAVWPSYAFAGLQLPLSWLLIYVLITNIVNEDRRFFVFMLSYLLYNLKMSQHAVRSWASDGFVFRTWGAQGAPGWFQNSGEFGIEMTMFVPISIAFILGTRQYWGNKLFLAALFLPVSALISAVASSSRGALVGMAAVAVWFVLKSRYRIRVALLVAVAGAALWVITPPEQKARFESAGEDETSTVRLTYWEDGIEIGNQHPVLGIGFDNWLPYYHNYYNPVGHLPHNIFIEAFAELGYSGLIAFVALILTTFFVNYRTRKRLGRLAARDHPRARFMWFMAHGLDGALIGFLASGFFVTVLYYPFFWINLAFTVSLSRAARRLLARERRARIARRGASPGVVPGGGRQQQAALGV